MNTQHYSVRMRTAASKYMHAQATSSLDLSGLGARVRSNVVAALRDDYTKFCVTSEAGGVYRLLCGLYGWKASTASESRNTVYVAMPLLRDAERAELLDKLEAHALMLASQNELMRYTRGNNRPPGKIFEVKHSPAFGNTMYIYSWCLPAAFRVRHVMDMLAPHRASMRDPERVEDAVNAVKEGRTINWSSGVRFE